MVLQKQINLHVHDIERYQGFVSRLAVTKGNTVDELRRIKDAARKTMKQLKTNRTCTKTAGGGVGGHSTLAAAGRESIAAQSNWKSQTMAAHSSTEAFVEGSSVDVLLFGFKKNDGNFATSFNASQSSDGLGSNAHVVKALKHVLRTQPIINFNIATVGPDGKRLYSEENTQAAGGIGKLFSTHPPIEERIAALEGGVAGIAVASGQAALHLGLATIAGAGSHVLASRALYGGSQNLLGYTMKRFGIETTFVDPRDLDAWRSNIRPNTKVCWLETPTNPTLKIFDIRKIADALKGTGVILVVDNTFATSINQNPLLLGADIVSHSLTKYVGGHSDVIAGALMLNDKALYDRLFFVLKTMGTGLSAFDSWIVIRGSKTLAIRVEKSQSTAMKIA